MKRSGAAALVIIGALGFVGQAQAHFRMVDPFGKPMRALQRVVNASYLPQPHVTVTVWPLKDVPGGDQPGVGGMDFWGQRPFLITVGKHPSPDELFHELGHVVDDGWQTPGQRCAFERVFAFAPHGWFFPDGSDAVSDNWAQGYALASLYGRHVQRATVESWTGIRGPGVWPHLYGWILGIAQQSLRSAAASADPQSTAYCG